MTVGIASWQLLDWFGEISGIKNTSRYDAEGVVIHTGGDSPVEAAVVPAGGEVEFKTTNQYVSISWMDGAGMHADIVRLEQ
jgi:hypothetical protein